MVRIQKYREKLTTTRLLASFNIYSNHKKNPKPQSVKNPFCWCRIYARMKDQKI